MTAGERQRGRRASSPSDSLRVARLVHLAQLPCVSGTPSATIAWTCGQPLVAVHLLLEGWPSLITRVFITEAEVSCSLPAQHIKYGWVVVSTSLVPSVLLRCHDFDACHILTTIP